MWCTHSEFAHHTVQHIHSDFAHHTVRHIHSDFAHHMVQPTHSDFAHHTVQPTQSAFAYHMVPLLRSDITYHMVPTSVTSACCDIGIWYCSDHKLTSLHHGSINSKINFNFECIHRNTAMESTIHCWRFWSVRGPVICLSETHSPTTPDNARNQPTTYPDCLVYRFDSTKFKWRDSVNSLDLMIQNSLFGAKFSFVRGSKNNR
jgi:hypothetical protein